MTEGQAIVLRAKRLYVEAGNPLEDWPITDECVRAHFLIAAVRAKDETPERPLLSLLQ